MRKLGSIMVLLVLMVSISFFIVSKTSAAVGATTVCTWKGNKSGAFAITFDDGCESNVDWAIPQMSSRGLVGTFYINPGTWRYEIRETLWETTAVQNGMELGNHTMEHSGASNYQEAYNYTIGECSRIIWNITAPFTQNKLTTFASCGGCVWGLSSGE